MQNQFRKYYIDTYLDLQHKNDEDLIAEENSISPNARLTNNTRPAPQAVEYQPADNSENLERRETSTRDTVIKVQDWKKEQYRKQFLKEQNKKEDGE